MLDDSPFEGAALRGVRPDLNAIGDSGDASAASAGADARVADIGPTDDGPDDEIDMQIGEEQRKAILRKEPHQPTKEEVEEHEATGHVVHRSWCLHCKRARVTDDPHRRGHMSWRRRKANSQLCPWIIVTSILEMVVKILCHVWW